MSKPSKLSFLHRLEGLMNRYHLPLMPVIWGVTCSIIGVLILIGLYSYSSAEKAIAHQFNSQQLSLIQQTASSLENFFIEIQNDLFLLTNRPEPYYLSAEKREEILSSLFTNFQGKVNFLIFASEKGECLHYPSQIFSKKPCQDLLISPNLEKIKKTKKPVIIEKITKTDVSIPGFVLIAIPVFKGEIFQGILGGGLNTQFIHEKFLISLPVGARGNSWIVNAEGTIIAHSDSKMVGERIYGGENKPGLVGEDIWHLMRKDMANNQAGIGEGLWRSSNGEKGKIKVLIAYTPVELAENKWMIGLAKPYAEVTEVVWASFKNSALLLVIMAGTLLSGTYLGHKINQSRIRAEEKVKWGEEILKTQNRLQILFDGSPDAIAIIDRDFRITMLNKTGLNWYKKSLFDFLGKKCYQEFQGRSDPCPNCPAQETFQTGKTAYRDRASLIAEGTKKYLQLYTFPLTDQNGEVQEVVEYVKDVTAEKILQQQIIQSERLAVVGKMSANVAHEIKNPLSTIVLNAELLEDELARLGGAESEEARQLLRVIKSEIDHLLEVIEEYLQFARLPKLKLEPGNINEVVEQLLFFLREEANERKIYIVEELANMLPPVLIDTKQLRQALLNIIKNSFEAMPQGGKLTVTTKHENGRVEISIADTGRGIPEENLDLVFTPFFSTKQGGTGLGLSITSHIIQEHKGSISVKSYKDLGTIFTISLPVLAEQNKISHKV